MTGYTLPNPQDRTISMITAPISQSVAQRQRELYVGRNNLPADIVRDPAGIPWVQMPVSEGLPDWHELMAGAFTWGAGEHPVAVCAFRLARAHRHRRPRRRTLAARRRKRQIEAIDAWAAAHVRSPARVESIGAYIDRMTAAAAQAHHALRNSEEIGDAVHAAFTEAAELAAGWGEITSEAVPSSYQIGADRSDLVGVIASEATQSKHQRRLEQ